MNKLITMLVDYNNHFYTSVLLKNETMDIEAIRGYFAGHGYDLVVKQFKDVDFLKENYSGQPVLYQSSEDRDLFYKSYIEDILLGLQIQGARLIPDFYAFRAHHNKVFMEIMRDLNPNQQIKNISSKGFGALEEFKNDLPNHTGPVVMKPAAGWGSQGVRLLKSDPEKIKHAEKISRSIHWVDALKNLYRDYRYPFYAKRSNHRQKFIAQTFVPGLSNDYKVLVYAEKYYTLMRRNRKDDFRASGSGLFEFPPLEALPPGLLDFARSVFNSFSVPIISLDIACDEKAFYLLEFQFLQFGTYTLIKSPFYALKENDDWRMVKATSNLEEEFVNSVCWHLSKTMDVQK
jgi:hypothetical protein